MDLSPGIESAFLAIDYLIWAVFAAEYGIKLYLAPNRRQFVAHHIPDLIIVLVPMLRPLRVLRSVRLLRLLRLALLTGLAAKGLREARNILRRRGLNWVLLIVLVLNLIAAAIVLEFERGNPDANIHSYPERFSRWFERLAREAGLPKIRLHDVRHSYATAALAAGVPAKVVSERLGHANIAITMDTYSHVLPGMDERAASVVARLILDDEPPGEAAR